MLRFMIIGWALVLMGCQSATPAGSRIPEAVSNPARTSMPRSTPQVFQGLRVRIHEATNPEDDSFSIDAGTTARMVIRFEPVIIEQQAHGLNAVADEWANWEMNGMEMRVCTALDMPCALQAPWIPFRETHTTGIPMNWIGEQPVWFVIEVRSADGAFLPLLNNNTATTHFEHSLTLVGIADPSMPPAITGSLVIAGGSCCIGGDEGEIITLTVDFAGYSPYGTIHSMRIGPAGVAAHDLGALIDGQPWEPFVATKAFTTSVRINWSNWDLCVQYRDDHATISPLYCDTIQIEGQ